MYVSILRCSSRPKVCAVVVVVVGRLQVPVGRQVGIGGHVVDGPCVVCCRGLLTQRSPY